MVDPTKIFDLKSSEYFSCQCNSDLAFSRFLSRVSGNKNITGNIIIIPKTIVTIKIPLGSPKNSSANTPITGAIIGAIPIIATTLERGLPELESRVVSLIMALETTLPTLAPIP